MNASQCHTRTQQSQYVSLPNIILLVDVIKSMRESLVNGDSQWWLSDGGSKITVVTRQPKNVNLSSNGGDYFFYDEYVAGAGHITKYETTSCDIDFDWGFETTEYSNGSGFVAVFEEAARFIDHITHSCYEDEHVEKILAEATRSNNHFRHSFLSRLLESVRK